MTRVVYQDKHPGELQPLGFLISRNCSISHQHTVLKRGDEKADQSSGVGDRERYMTTSVSLFPWLIFV